MALSNTIAIIGASGKMGSAIAKGIAAGTDKILLFGKDDDKLATLLKEIKAMHPSADVEVTNCPTDACWEADIIIPAVPYVSEEEIAEKIREFSTGKIVISISNPLNSSLDGLITNPGTSAGENLQKLLPHSKVIKAFNTNFAAAFSQPIVDGKAIDSFIAGDDIAAVETVAELVSRAGFNPVHTGPLITCRTLESMTVLLLHLTMKNTYNGHAGWKILHN